jgi:predicted cupin superfamily sugar epimerase
MQALIDKYQLIPHPEGGYYREVYRSKLSVTSAAIHQDRQAVSHIYFLLPKGQVSRFHHVIHDEIWNFYEGDPIRLIKYNGFKVEEDIIGPGCKDYAAICEGGVYQAAESTGDYSLAGCTVAPGFEFEDFSFIGDDPETRETLLRRFPAYLKFI